MLANVLKYPLILGALVGAGACDPRLPASEAQVTATPAAYADRASYHAQVLFEFQRASLGSDGRKLLDELARQLLDADVERLTATAHTDRIGDAAYNEVLAERRAEAIRAYLLEKGVPEERVRVEGKGARQPVSNGRCEGLGPETRQNAKLIDCLQPDRRAEIEVRVRAAK